MYNEDLSCKYADLQNQSEIEKDNYKLQITQLNERVIIHFYHATNFQYIY